MYTVPTGEIVCGGVCIAMIGGAVVGAAIEYGIELYQNDGPNECVGWDNVAIGSVLGGNEERLEHQEADQRKQKLTNWALVTF